MTLLHVLRVSWNKKNVVSVCIKFNDDGISILFKVTMVSLTQAGMNQLEDEAGILAFAS